MESLSSQITLRFQTDLENKYHFDWFQRSIWLAALWMRHSLLETLEKHFFASCLLCTCWALPRAYLHISVFRACATRPKVASVSSGTKVSAILRKNWKGRVCLLLLFHEWQNPELLRGYPYFQNVLLLLMIFRNKYSRAVTVGMYALLTHMTKLMTCNLVLRRCTKSSTLPEKKATLY